jgi:hypothetical protein
MAGWQGDIDPHLVTGVACYVSVGSRSPNAGSGSG